MLYLQKGQENTLYLNINNNSRDTFTDYTLTFTHVMSKEVKNYVIDTNDANEFFQNIRYCTITLDLETDDLNYEGQYTLEIYGSPGTQKVYNGMVVLEGTAESNPFTEYISDNEVNENYIYIQE
tara:strand:+ start:1357 stop:1728 length:372 start_codon:yes stop_codon:yes gene_type:complete